MLGEGVGAYSSNHKEFFIGASQNRRLACFGVSFLISKYKTCPVFCWVSQLFYGDSSRLFADLSRKCAGVDLQERGCCCLAETAFQNACQSLCSHLVCVQQAAPLTSALTTSDHVAMRLSYLEDSSPHAGMWRLA